MCKKRRVTRFEGFEDETHKCMFTRGSKASNSRAPNKEMRLWVFKKSVQYIMFSFLENNFCTFACLKFFRIPVSFPNVNEALNFSGCL